MISRTLIKPKNKNSTLSLPVFGKKFPERTFSSESKINGRELSSLYFGHNFGNVRVESGQSFKNNCPLALSGPSQCPYGGACHTCQSKVQDSLKIGQFGDKYEQEADKVADEIMRLPNSQVQRKGCLSFNDMDEEEKIQTKPIARRITPLVQRQVEDEEEEEAVLQPKEIPSQTPGVTQNLQTNINNLSGSGKPLSVSERSFFGPRFGYDFSQVRVHSGVQAARLTRAVNAKAFTVGRDVVFEAGQYAPETNIGQQLLAHELTHVIQQNGGSSATVPSLGQTLRAPSSTIRRKQLFSSTMKICHRVLKSRTFKVSQGSVSVIADAEWVGPGGDKKCGAAVYPMTLSSEGILWDSERESCDFRVDRADIQTWTNVPSDNYYLTIWPNNTNPNCCLYGTIKVLEQSGVKGPSCGGRVRNEKTFLDVLHLSLDAAGMVPALGVVPDAINATIYSVEGDWANAGISAAAMIPIFGQGATATKWGVKVTAEAVERVGKEGIEQGLKKAAKKEAAERAGKEATEKVGKETAEKTLKKKIAECEAIHAAYKALGNCRSCRASDTPTERATKIACITAVLAGRRKYLKEKCDYVLPGSIARGSLIAERGHEIQVAQFAKMLAKCSTLPTS